MPTRLLHDRMPTGIRTSLELDDELVDRMARVMDRLRESPDG